MNPTTEITSLNAFWTVVARKYTALSTMISTPTMMLA